MLRLIKLSLLRGRWKRDTGSLSQGRICACAEACACMCMHNR